MTDEPVSDDALDDDFDPSPPPDMEAVRSALRDTLKECWVCGERDWSMPVGPNYIHPGLDPDGEVDFSYGIKCVAVICKGCGFVGMHHIDTLLR
jgi:hypothetical protein